MGWFFRSLMVLFVFAGCLSGWQAGGIVARDLDIESSSLEESTTKESRSSLVGKPLEARVLETLNIINAQREASKDKFSSKTLFLEKVSYERSAGAVVARGSISDWGSPRTLNVVIDAFDGSGTYISSGSSSVNTQNGSTVFSVSLIDNDVFQRFSVRFLDERMEDVVMRSATSGERKIPPLLSDDPIQSADLAEVANRLVILGYAEKPKPLRDEIVASAILKRFRADHDIDGPPGVTIGDLIALRLISPPMAETANLSGY